MRPTTHEHRGNLSRSNITRATWTTERVEQLHKCVTAGLTCSQIAAEIGVTRNAVIGKIHRLGLTTSGRPGRRPLGLVPRMRSEPAAPRRQTRLTRIFRAIAEAGPTVVPFPADDRGCRSRARGAARCSSLPAAAAAGRSAIPARPTSASAATTRSRASPIARAMRVLPTGCPPGGARRARVEGLGVGALRGSPCLQMRSSPRSTLPACSVRSNNAHTCLIFAPDKFANRRHH